MITEDLDSIVYEMASEKAYATHRADDLSMELESRLVRGDHILLSKLFFEVIDNAFKFSEPNTQIEIKSYVKDNFYCVSVTDHGLGMDQVEIEAISPFVQFNRFEHEQQGIGLGLAIVIKILALYNGDIKIISEKGKYTVVIISLILAGES